jgi:hypothetical protein
VNGDQRARTPAFKAVMKTCLLETQDADPEKLIRAADDVAWMCAPSTPEFLDQLGDYFRLRRSSDLRF